MKKRSELCNFLAYTRKSHNYTQQHVADVLNISRQTYGHYEIGRLKPSVEILYRLSKFYQIPFDRFLELAVSNAEKANYISAFSELEEQIDSHTDYNAYVEHFDKKIRLLEQEERVAMYYFHSLSRTCKNDAIALMRAMKKNHANDINPDEGTGKGDGTIWKKH